MSAFEPAIAAVLEHEGGWNDTPGDRGGETNFGISLRFLKAEGLTPAEIGLPNFEPGALKVLTRGTAEALYRRFFWDRGHLHTIVDQAAATKVFDVTVNAGHRRAALLAQAACEKLGVPVAHDGILGPATVAAINRLHPQTFVNAVCDAQAAFYHHLIEADPTQRKFLNGWLRRAAWGLKR